METNFFGDGKFEFIVNENEKEMYINAWNAITTCNMWNWLKTYEPEYGFMSATHQNIDIISNEMLKESIARAHSGASYALTMRAMQYIAKNGYIAFKEEKINYYKEKMQKEQREQIEKKEQKNSPLINNFFTESQPPLCDEISNESHPSVCDEISNESEPLLCETDI